MSIDVDMRERHSRVLAELAETGMAMVRRLSQAMERAQDVPTQVQLGLAFHRVSRAVRQTMALEFRLAQEARRQDRAGAAPQRPASPNRTTPSATAADPTTPRPSPERVGWNEHERDDSDEALDALDVLLEAETLDIEAVHQAVEASMASIRRDIAVDPALAKAGVLRAGGATPQGLAGLPPSASASRNRRSALMGGIAPAGPALPARLPTVGNPGKSGWRSSA